MPENTISLNNLKASIQQKLDGLIALDVELKNKVDDTKNNIPIIIPEDVDALAVKMKLSESYYDDVKDKVDEVFNS